MLSVVMLNVLSFFCHVVVMLNVNMMIVVAPSNVLSGLFVIFGLLTLSTESYFNKNLKGQTPNYSCFDIENY